MKVEVSAEEICFSIEVGDEVTVSVRGEQVTVRAGEAVRVALDGQGPVIDGVPVLQTGERRPDGTLITASVPQPATRR